VIFISLAKMSLKVQNIRMKVQPMPRAGDTLPDSDAANHRRRLELVEKALSVNPDLIDQPGRLFEFVGNLAGHGAEVVMPMTTIPLDHGEVTS
jgi:hypothetical protein